MSITLFLPSLLRQLCAGQEQLDISLQELGTAPSMESLIDHLEQRHPGLRERLLDGAKVHPYLNIYVNDSDIRFAQKLATPLATGDEVVILTAVAGGAPE